MTNKHLLSLLLAGTVGTASIFAQQVTPATSFGNKGSFKILADNDFAIAKQALVQPDGKLLFSVTTTDASGYGEQQELYRLTINGQLDQSFGKGGMLPGGITDAYKGIIRGGYFDLQPDGKIVTANANIDRQESRADKFIVQRFLPNGKPDASFGTNGLVKFTSPFSIGFPTLSAGQIKVKPNGKIVLVARLNTTTVLGQFRATGHADRSFGKGGLLQSPSPYEQNIRNLLVLSNNSFITASNYKKPDNNFGTCLVMHKDDGTIDSTMGTNGVVFVNNNLGKDDYFSSNISVGLTQQDNKLLVYTATMVGGTLKNVLLRYLPDGTPDANFGKGGTVVADALDARNDAFWPHIVQIQQNDRIIISAPSKLERFLANGRTDTAFGNSGVLTQTSLSSTLVFTSNENRLYIVGADNVPHVLVNAYKFCNNCDVIDNTELLTKAAKATSGLAGIKLYPNPVKDKLTITGLHNGLATHLQLTAASGQIVQKATTQNATYQWNLQSLPSGIYFLNIITGNGVPATYKVIKE